MFTNESFAKEAACPTIESAFRSGFVLIYKSKHFHIKPAKDATSIFFIWKISWTTFEMLAVKFYHKQL